MTPQSAETIRDLSREVRSMLALASDRRLRDMAGEFPDRARIDRVLAPQSLAVARWLDDLKSLASSVTEPLVLRLAAAAPVLQWRQSYRAEDFGAEFLESYGWTELIGQRGPLASERIAAGFLLLGPRTTYPDHAHEAEEFYLPLAGTASWRRNNEDWRIELPGSIIEHRSWQVHATRTQGEPLLAFYIWRGGDLSQKPKLGSA
jgi:hypothetical protein